MKSGSFPVAGGRRIACNIYGDAGHFPVAFFHGLGGSRNSITVDEAWLRQKRWSLVSFDRPGVGDSGALPAYTLEQVAADAAALIAHLGHQRCAALGWSAGGPFAMAFAGGFPELVDFLALVNTAMPVGDGKGGWWPSGSRQWMVLACRYLPALANPFFYLAARRYRRNPKLALARAIARMAPADRELLQSPAMQALLRQASDDAWGSGGYGPACDARALGHRLAVRLDDVRIPVHLWQGEQDISSGTCRLEKLAHRFPKASIHRVKQAGHLLYLQHAEKILEVSLW